MTKSNGLQFGIFPTPNAASFDEDLRLIRLADDIGFSLLGQLEWLILASMASGSASKSSLAWVEANQ